MGRALGDSLSVEMVDCPGVVAVIGSPKANGGRRRPARSTRRSREPCTEWPTLPLPTRWACQGVRQVMVGGPGYG